MRPVRNDDGEQDVFTGWRRVLVWTNRPGATRKVKSRANRRDRRQARRRLRDGGDV